VTAAFLSNQEIILQERRNLAQGPWDYLTCGVESETTMRRNRLGFDRIALRPRVLRDVSRVDPSATFLGQRLRIPVMLSPIGVQLNDARKSVAYGDVKLPNLNAEDVAIKLEEYVEAVGEVLGRQP